MSLRSAALLVMVGATMTEEGVVQNGPTRPPLIRTDA